MVLTVIGTVINLGNDNWAFETDDAMMSADVCTGIDEIVSSFGLPITNEGERVKITIELGRDGNV